MTIIKIFAIGFLLHLVTNTPVEARNVVQEFCGDRYCGQYRTDPVKKKVYKTKSKAKKKLAYKKKKVHPTRVASLGKELTYEPVTASYGLVAKAEQYLGRNPTGYASLWCGRFIAYIAPHAASALKRMGLNPAWARDYARLPGAKRHGAVGDLVVITRGRGGHVGVVKGFDKNGNPIAVSGNFGRAKVGVGTYNKHRVIAYVSI